MATNATRGTVPAVETVGTPTLWIIGGLAIAILGGMLGSFFDPGDDMQSILYSLAAVGGTVAGLLLLIRHTRARLDLSAAGFGALGVISIAGSVFSFTGPGYEAVSAYLAVLHWPAMWLIAAQNWAPIWSRGAAAFAGLMFALWGYSTVLGDELPDTNSPMAIVGWIGFTVAAIGWVLTLREEGEDAGTSAGATTARL